MNKKYIFFLTVGIVFALLSCKKDKPDDPIDEPAEVNYDFISSGTVLATGIKSTNVSLQVESIKKLDIQLAAPVEIDPILKDGIKKIITIDPLTEGQKVSDIHFGGSFVFVSYQAPETEKYRGTVDVFSIEQVPGITRVARFSFTDVDVNAVCYAGGGRLLLGCSSAEKPAFIESIAYNPAFPDYGQAKERTIDLTATNIKSMVVTGKKLYVIANDNEKGNGVYIFDNIETTDQPQFAAIANPLSITAIQGSNDVYVLQDNSIARLSSSGQVTGNTPLKISGQTKGFIAKERLYVHADNQMQVFNSDGSERQAQFSWDESSSGNNMLSKNVSIMNDWLVFLGKDGSGIRLCGLRNNPNADVTEVHNLSGLGQSLALLATDRHLAFIADQSGALQVLWRVSRGFPDLTIYLQNFTTISQSLRSAMGSANNYNKYQNLHNDIAKVKVQSPTKIYVSIAQQDGEFESSLGYYLIKDGTIPATASGLNKIIVFPNTKTAQSIGNTVALCDADGNAVTFEAGQELGFYFISNGWNSSLNNGYGGVSPNLPVMYTHKQYNKNNYQQHLLFKLDGLYPAFIGFEDKWYDESSDMDMNDIIIAISDNMNDSEVTKIDMSIISVPISQ